MKQDGDEDFDQTLIEESWREFLTKGNHPANAPWYQRTTFRRLFRHLPTEPRCKLCYMPFHGVGGAITRRLFGVKRSRLNPQLCDMCERFAEKFHGGAEVELTILFADVRGSTTLAEKMKTAAFSQLISKFYAIATGALFDHDAMVEKLAGDAVTGFFTPGFAKPNHAQAGIDTAKEILQATGHSDPSVPWVPIGIGLHTGLAYVGTVHSEMDHIDIAVLGDTANIGARLASQAETGEIVLSHTTASIAGLKTEGMEKRRLSLKGRKEAVDAWVLTV